MDRILSTLGLALRARKCLFGLDTVLHNQQKLVSVLLALDAGENVKRSAQLLSDRNQIPLFILPFSKNQLGSALGQVSCAIVALTDIGFTNSIETEFKVPPVSN
jgi:ribosomal protein L7Ae-like RNA K-turn-binding protein